MGVEGVPAKPPVSPVVSPDDAHPLPLTPVMAAGDRVCFLLPLLFHIHISNFTVELRAHFEVTNFTFQSEDDLTKYIFKAFYFSLEVPVFHSLSYKKYETFSPF